jgi:hypothetical protein
VVTRYEAVSTEPFELFRTGISKPEVLQAFDVLMLNGVNTIFLPDI